MESGYGDVELAAYRDGLVEVVFANGDVIRLDPAALGVTGQLTVGVDECGAAVLIGTAEGERQLDWMVVRAAGDQAFAQHLRERDAEEARRIGRRLRALRENRGMSQKAVAGLVDMSSPQLAKLEQGETDMRISTLRSLLRALGADFADIAGPDAPEVSAKELGRRAQRAGVPADVIKRIVAAVDPRHVADVLARGLGWEKANLLADRVTSPVLAHAPTLKRRSASANDNPALLALAESLAQRSALAFAGRPSVVPADPRALRELVVSTQGEITLEALVRWCWQAGIVVVPMLARGGFSAGAWLIGEQPVVVLKETPNLKAWWLFALAHELGHLAYGHVGRSGLVDLGSGWEGGDDEQEEQANAWALDLLVPDHAAMLEEIRRRLWGLDPDEKLKWKAMDVARERGYNVPLVLLVTAFGLRDLARDDSRWGSANNEAAKDGPARAVVAHEFRRNLELDRLDRLDAALIRALAVEE